VVLVRVRIILDLYRIFGILKRKQKFGVLSVLVWEVTNGSMINLQQPERVRRMDFFFFFDFLALFTSLLLYISEEGNVLVFGLHRIVFFSGVVRRTGNMRRSVILCGPLTSPLEIGRSVRQAEVCRRSASRLFIGF